ncbi:CLN3_protein [Hexamita inflata]|uniref:CLN3_protein n=1 Tax=Hexamita inflata TaxID=28002 RepID=A0ABP1HRK3_9EUKA
MNTEPTVNIISFIISGWVNNFGFTVMLSAALTMMHGKVPVSAVLLCDIMPCFLVQLVLPFCIDKISYPIKVVTIVICALLGFILAIFADVSVIIALVGVAFHSFSQGLGEMTFLAYSTKFSPKCVSAFSSGTGLAGITGAGIFAILSDLLHLDLKVILYIFLPVPLFMLLSYYISNPKLSPGSDNPELLTTATTTEQAVQIPDKSFKSKFKSLGPILPLILSLLLVYFCQYLINQSVNAVINFPGKYDGKFYTFSQFSCQFGVFLARSSLPLFKIPFNCVFIPSILQLCNLILFCFEAIYSFIPSFWLMLVLVFFEGIFGGLVYSSSMHWISVISNNENKEFRMGIICVFNNLGILGASCLGFWLEPFLRQS